MSHRRSTWRDLEVADTLRRLDSLLTELGGAIERERELIAALDHEALDANTLEQEELVGAIKALGGVAAVADAGGPEARAELLGTASAVRVAAQVNAILLHDALALVSQALGTGGRPSGYDRHARHVEEPRLTVAKAV